MLRSLDITHVVWVPDSALGMWDADLQRETSLSLVRPCREGEALGLAAGLWLGGARPFVMMQCTGLYEAGDALRNIIHDLRIPIPMLVGIRSYFAAQKGMNDSAAEFVIPILRAWRIQHTLVDRTGQFDSLLPILQQARGE
ncbi:MAG: hypothetical protein U1D30_09915 [Planctomycetota bacterium]